MPDTLRALTSPRARTKQNWVLDPLQDSLFIIAAPLISLGLALLAMQVYGAARGAAMIIMAHVILTVAHHMPTFIRIYGDAELFRRFKWNFVLGPVVPLLFSMGVLGYINYHQYPVEYFLYLYIFLSLWDPWHFLRQHFGFMRIYDRHNAAPVKLASNMDWAICTIWFVYIMVASAEWLPGLLEDLYRNAHLPLLLALPVGVLPALQDMTWWLAVFTTLVYAGYLLWCRHEGFYVSPAKIALMICTFGVMYFTYTPNEWILKLAPAWGFKVGFATVGIVHMTQYLAIVWRYDQRIAQQGRARRGLFSWLHGRRTHMGVLLAAGVYVLFCIGYGDVITTRHENRWLMSALLAIGFTSTLMHYYFDGFIWKVRHQQNRAALDMKPGEGDRKDTHPSWWSSAREMTAGRMFLRQLLYFGVPMGVLTFGALSIWHQDNASYVQYMYRAQTLSQQGNAVAATEAANKAYAQMQAEWPLADKMAEIQPTSANQAQLGFLLYNKSLYENLVMPSLAGHAATKAQRQAHAENISRAAQLLLDAVYQGGSVAHAGRENLTAQQAQAVALSWRAQLAR